MFSFIRFATTPTQRDISLARIEPPLLVPVVALQATDHFISRPAPNRVLPDIFDNPILSFCLMYFFGVLTGIAVTSLSRTGYDANPSILPTNRVLEPLEKKTWSSCWVSLRCYPRSVARMSWSLALRLTLTGCAHTSQLLRSAPPVSGNVPSHFWAFIRFSVTKAHLTHELPYNPKATRKAIEYWLSYILSPAIKVSGLATLCGVQPNIHNDITPSSSNSSSSTLVESTPASSPPKSLRRRPSKSFIPSTKLASEKTWEIYAFRRGQRTSLLSQAHYFYLEPIIEERNRQTRLADAMKNPPISLTRRLSRKRAPSVSIVRGVKPKPIYAPAYSKETSLSWLSETIHDRISSSSTGDRLVE
ncbi:hypothetical protein SISNIDRAFT_488299 [Sistotremastrum niveocremeum HHB9708]|uniref:Uncharacterized protein n=1 Tax=Sistotremastrum niveocremeum HHB9708 TaxID=1314777 RepID=A0A164RBF2_9AGAM|nr:hypothetical protein SISNIDRAFT_488299 [Sistotremastrum niveocremeum HHB9708]